MKPKSGRLLWILPFVPLLLCSCDVHKKLAVWHYQQGMKKLAGGHGADALADFSAAVAQDPRFADAYFYRGACYFTLSNYTAAVNDFNQVTELEPGNGRAFFYNGAAELGLKDFPRAITNFTRAIGNLLTKTLTTTAAWHGQTCGIGTAHWTISTGSLH